MSSFFRWFLALVLTPIVGFIAAFCMGMLEDIVRNFIGQPAVTDMAARHADQIVTPFLRVGYTVFCWIYILPLSHAFRPLRPIISAALIAAAPLSLGVALFHQPDLDYFPMTLVAMISVVGVPVFMSALVTRLILGPNNSFKPKPLRGSA